MSDLRKEKHEIKPDKVSVTLFKVEEYCTEFVKTLHELLDYNPFELKKIDEKFPYRKNPIKNTILTKLLFLRGKFSFCIYAILSTIIFIVFGILEIFRSLFYRPIKTIINLFYYYINIPRFIGITSGLIISTLPFVFNWILLLKVIIPLLMVISILFFWGVETISFIKNFDYYIISCFEYTNLVKYERCEFYHSEENPYKSEFGNLFEGLSMQQAKIKYRNLVKEYHPDNLKTGDKEKFQKITKEFNQYTYYLANPYAYKRKI